MRNLLSLLCMIICIWMLGSTGIPATALAQQESADRVRQLVPAILEAYGGKEAVAGITSVIARGTITDYFKQSSGEYARYFARPNRLRIEIQADQAGELRILDGARGWRGSRSTVAEVQNAPLQAMLYQYSYLDLPMGLTDGTYTITDGGKKEFRGKVLDVLMVQSKGAPAVVIYLDPETRLIVRAAAEFSMGMGGTQLSTEYEDYRPVGKVLFPFRLVNYAGETKLSVISLSDIQVNAAIPATTFAPPGH